MNTTHRYDLPATISGLGLGALVVLTIIPYAEGQPTLPTLDLGMLVAFVGFGGLALLVAAGASALGERHRAAARLETAALWAACGLAVLGAVASVASSATTLSLERIVLAQRAGSLFVLHQPAAASVYVVALALAAQSTAVRGVLGEPSRARAICEAIVITTLSALGATLFLAGFAGTGLPGPVWLALKTALVAAVVVLMRRRLGGLPHGPRLAIAWAAAIVGLLNLAVTCLRGPQ